MAAMDSHENTQPSNHPACSSASQQRKGPSLSISAPAFTPALGSSRSASTDSSSNNTPSTKIPSLYSPLTGSSIWEQPDRPPGGALYRPPSRLSTSKAELNEDEIDADADVEAILRLTSNMHSFVDLHRQRVSEKQPVAAAPISISGCRPPSPQSTAVFSADLDRIHGWFREELQDDTRRLMTVFSLVQLMPAWQQDFLVQLIAQGKDKLPPGSAKAPSPRAAASPPIVAAASDAQLPPRSTSSTGPLSWRNRSTDTEAPPKLAAPIPRRTSGLIHEDAHGQQHSQWTAARATAPPLMRASSSFTPATTATHSTAAERWPARSNSSSSDSSSSSEQHLSFIEDATYVSYFWSDFRTWLRLLRLHKYEPVLSRIDRHRLLSSTEADLERAGVKAMGARNKFLRLFEQIRRAEDSLR